MANVNVTELRGSIEPRVKYVWGDDYFEAYSYAIHRDEHGKETHRTEPELNSTGRYV